MSGPARLRIQVVALAVAAVWVVGGPLAARAHGAGCGGSLGVVLLVDDSGSTADTDPGGLRAAAIGAWLAGLPEGAQVAADSFDTVPREAFGPTRLTSANRAPLAAVLTAQLSSGAGTDDDAAFQAAHEQLDAMRGATHKAVILLSDGQADGAAPAGFVDAGAPVFTVGFGGDAGSLAPLATDSGGAAFSLGSAADASAILAQILARLGCTAGSAPKVGGGSRQTQVPVVLVSGLKSVAAGLTGGASEDCARAGSFETICRRFRAASASDAVRDYPVWAPPIVRSKSATTIDSTGDLRTDARLLAAWLREHFPRGARPPVLIGHSRGGLIARDAISVYGAPSAGLVTVASPFNGSYLADLWLAASAAPGSQPLAGAIDALFGLGVALPQLTRAYMRFDQHGLARLGASTAMFAGTSNGAPWLQGWNHELYPNDGAVAKSSAFAKGINLGVIANQATAPLCHSAKVPLCTRPAELETPEVFAFLLAAVRARAGSTRAAKPVNPGAGSTEFGLRARPAAVLRAGGRGRHAGEWSWPREGPRTLDIPLSRVVATIRTAMGELATGLVVSDRLVVVHCDQGDLPAQQFAANVFAVDTVAAGCRRPRLDPEDAVGTTVVAPLGSVTARIQLGRPVGRARVLVRGAVSAGRLVTRRRAYRLRRVRGGLGLWVARSALARGGRLVLRGEGGAAAGVIVPVQ